MKVFLGAGLICAVCDCAMIRVCPPRDKYVFTCDTQGCINFHIEFLAPTFEVERYLGR